MTDRELLEMAARAAGYGLPSADDHDEIGRQYEYHLGLWVKHPWGWGWFRPHIDDGQSLRLAVRMGIEYCYGYGLGGEVQRVIVYDDLHVMVQDGDVCAAVRRAITSAAAQIQLDEEKQ